MGSKLRVKVIVSLGFTPLIQVPPLATPTSEPSSLKTAIENEGYFRIELAFVT